MLSVPFLEELMRSERYRQEADTHREPHCSYKGLDISVTQGWDRFSHSSEEIREAGWYSWLVSWKTSELSGRREGGRNVMLQCALLSIKAG